MAVPTGISAGDTRSLLDVQAKPRRRISFLKAPLGWSAHLTKEDLGERANHRALNSLPCWEVEAFLHDIAQTATTRSTSVGKQDRARSRMCIRRRRKGGGKIRPVPGQGEQKTILTTQKHPGLGLSPKDTADASHLPAGGTLLGQNRGTCSLKYNIW
jgi:hypothetical protein